VLSFTFDVAYVYSVLGVLAWSFIGHVVTLDDDMLGGWDNPDKDKKLWRGSLIELAVKAMMFAVVLIVLIWNPEIAKFGS